MPCGCTKNKKKGSPVPPPPPPPPTAGGTAAFELKLPSGQVLSFGSRLEADAAKARRGNTGTVRAV